MTGLAWAGLARGAQGQTTGNPAVSPGAGPLATPYPNQDPLFLVDRLTQGTTPELRDAALTRGYSGFLDWQLDADAIDDSRMDRFLTTLPTLSMSSKQIFDAYVAMGGNQAVPVIELEAAHVMRSVYSRRQLKERMVEFWSDHFSVDHNDGEVRVLKTQDDRDVIRVHALGTFPELLVANAQSAAMSYYLDNYANVALAPNENYARELMELHTLGVTGPYSEQDVVEVARCFTGWGFFPRFAPNYGAFRFNPAQHDNGPKLVLGNVIPSGGGLNDGLTVLSILASHPSTAEFVSRKLARWLLMYDPPQSVVDAVTATYASTGGDIREMIRTLFDASTLQVVDWAGVGKFRRPFHLVTSLLRATEATIANPAVLVRELETLGQQPFRWPAPNGYPEALEAWGSALLPRWSFASRLFDGRIPGVNVDLLALVTRDGPVLPGQLGQRIDSILTGGRMAPSEVDTVQAYVDSFPNVTGPVLREAFALAASSPSYQEY